VMMPGFEKTSGNIYQNLTAGANYLQFAADQ